MKGRRENGLRRKVRLHVEFLENRVAPVVVNALTGPYTFTDGSGDQLTLTMFGSGQVDIYDAGGGAPAGTDISVMYFSGTTGSSFLTLVDDNAGVGGDDMTGGTSIFLDWSKTQLGGMTFDAGAGGTVHDTRLDDVNCLGLYVHADLVTGCDFRFGNKTVNNITLDAAAVDTTLIASLRSVKTLGIGGSLALSTIRIGQDVTTLEVLGAVGNMTQISVIRKAGTIDLQSGIDNSAIYVGGTAQTVSITGAPAMANGATLEVGRETKELNILGNMDASYVFLHGKAGTIHVAGNIQNASMFDVSGALKEMTIDWSVIGHSIIRVSGAVGTLGIEGDVTQSVIELSGNAKSTVIGGDLGGNTPGAGENSDLWIGGNATLVEIIGDVLGDPGDGGVNPRIPSHFEVEGTLGTLRVWGSVWDADLYCGANAKSITIGEGAAGGNDLVNSLLEVRETAKSIRIVGNGSSTIIRANALKSGVIEGDAIGLQIFVYDDAKFLNVTGSLNGGVLQICGSANTMLVGTIGSPQVVDVRGDLKTLTVAGDIGAAGAEPYIQAGSLGTATVGGVVYGNFNIYGTLGSILTAGIDATATPATDLPFTASGGAMEFRDAGGAVTGGIVQYMTLTGIVS